MQGQLMTSGNIALANTGGGAFTTGTHAADWTCRCAGCGQQYELDRQHLCQMTSPNSFLYTITGNRPMAYSGNRYLVVCNGSVTELAAANASMEAAQEMAEALAHQHQSEAYILKPVRKVAPKRDVVTTDL